jgi:hypothetical protein
MVATLAGFFGLAASAVFAAPVRWSGNGYYYEMVDDASLTWTQAKAEAEARTYLGVPGYLATLTSAAEQQFVETLLVPRDYEAYLWIGGFQLPGSPEPAGGWTWVTGELWDYTHWATGHLPWLGDEPSDPGNGQDVLVMWFDNRFGQFGEWADHFDSTEHLVVGYVVEYVPEPATLGLLVAGGLSLLRRRR